MGKFLEVIDISNCRNSKQVKQMDTYGNAYQECNEQKPTKVVCIICLTFPFEDCPKHNGGKARTHRIYLALHCRIPESIRKSVCQTAHKTASENSNHLCSCHFLRLLYKFLCQHRD